MKKLLIASVLTLAAVAPTVPAYAASAGGSAPSKSLSSGAGKVPKSTSVAGELNSGIQGVSAEMFIGIKDTLVEIWDQAGTSFPDDNFVVAMAKEYVCGVKRHFDLVPRDSRCNK